MATEIYLVKVGMTMTEGMVEEWYVPDGGTVKQGELLYRLETEKVNLDVDADASGTVKHGVAVGVTMQPGDVIGHIYAPGEAIPSSAPSFRGPSPPEPPSSSSPSPAPPWLRRPGPAPPCSPARQTRSASYVSWREAVKVAGAAVCRSDACGWSSRPTPGRSPKKRPRSGKNAASAWAKKGCRVLLNRSRRSRRSGATNRGSPRYRR